MRRSLYFIAILGMLATLVSAGTTTAAAASCETNFEARLNCWFRWIGEGTFVVTLNDTLPFDGDQQARRSVERKVVTTSRSHLIVEVPANHYTGPGGTALLLLAGVRWVEPSAHIDKLSPEAVKDLKAVNACDFNNHADLCARLADHPLRGSDLIKAGSSSDRSQHAYSVEAPSDPPTSTPATTQTPTEQTGTKKPADPLFGKKTTALAGLCALLVLLLTAFLVLVRRSSSQGPATAAHLAAPTAQAAQPRAPDEQTTRLRTAPATATAPAPAPTPAPTPASAPAPRHGREVGGRPGPAQTAVVRTELHPQGYVELDHVLYRAVWADPGRPPPGPGSLVDVTDARRRESDVLYAFPTAAGRHDQTTRT